jgi:tricorn protease
VQSIWSISVDGDKLTRVTQSGGVEGLAGPGGLGGGFSSLQFSKSGAILFYRQGKSIYTVPLLGGTPKQLTFTCKVEVDRRAENTQVFNESWRVMKHRFYDATMHGANWEKIRSTYEPLVEHVADQEELHNIINQMLGELNASHTGISGGFGGPAASGNQTRHPGFELTADKSGYYKVTHIYKNGPCDKDYIKLNVGDFVLAVDGQALKAGDNYWKNFTLSPGQKLEFTVNDKPAAEGAWKFKITPVSLGQLANLQYAKWVDDRKATVERLSGGQIGYLHIKQMSEPELRKFERDMAMVHGKKALIIDQRFNPGGNIDQQLLEILQQKQYQVTKGRNSTELTRPLRAFFGPMVVLANERSTSDAEVFPDGFKTLKLGKVVGVTTYGAVIGTGAYQLMDGSVIRTPGMGLWNVRGVNLENNGVVPDIYVDNTPEDFFAGRDAQLEKAVQVLQEQLQK